MPSLNQEARSLGMPSEQGLYHFRVPREPVDLLHTNPDQQDFGFSGEQLQTLIEYLRLQQEFEFITDSTIDVRIIKDLPDEKIRSALLPFLTKSISYKDIDLPTTIKAMVLEESITFQMIERLQGKQVEVWVDDSVSARLSTIGISLQKGLQMIDFGSYKPDQQRWLLMLLSEQYDKALEIAAANTMVPKGVAATVDIGAFFTLSHEERDNKRIEFSHLYDLEEQSRYAKIILDNPLLIPLGESLQRSSSHNEQAPPTMDDKGLGKAMVGLREIDVDQCWDQRQGEKWEDYIKRIDIQLSKLKPLYERKTLYEHFNAKTEQGKREVYCAFWRVAIAHGGCISVDFGDESYIFYELFLNPDGNLILRTRDELYEENLTQRLTEDPIDHYRSIEAIKKAVSSVGEELRSSIDARTRLEVVFGDDHTFLIESNILAALRNSKPTSVDTQGDGTTEQLAAFNELLSWDYSILRQLPIRKIQRTEIGSIEDIFSFISETMKSSNGSRNLLQEFIASTEANLHLYKRLFPQKKELYEVLHLIPGAAKEDIHRAYRAIVKELSAIRTCDQKDFDPVIWSRMRDRLEEVTAAYSILKNEGGFVKEVIKLGSLSTLFKNTT